VTVRDVPSDKEKVMVPLRVAPLFCLTLTLTLPSPLPPLAETVNHDGALLLTVHVVPDVTATLNEVAGESKLRDVGDTANVPV